MYILTYCNEVMVPAQTKLVFQADLHKSSLVLKLRVKLYMFCRKNCIYCSDMEVYVNILGHFLRDGGWNEGTEDDKVK
jgi:hypothetical protein